MDDMVHFDGDPATDSARRRMERVLKGPEPAPRWAWILAALGGGGVWLLWRSGRIAARASDAIANEPEKRPPVIPRRTQGAPRGEPQTSPERQER